MLKTGRLWPLLIYPPSKFIYRNNKRPTVYNQICAQCLNQSAIQYFTSTTIVLLSLSGACVGPINKYLQDGTLSTLYELRIPFFGNNEHTEFVVSLIWQGMISVVGLLGLALIEAGLALVNNTTNVSSKLDVLSLHQLSEQIESKQISGKQSLEQLKLIFMKIMYWDE